MGQDVVPTKGREFWLGFMSNHTGAESLSVFIASDVNTTGTVSVPQGTLNINFTVTANTTTEVNIPLTLEHTASEVIEGKGILIQTEDTVSVFSINFQDFTADGAKILPIQSIGNDYMIATYTDLFSSEFLIVATEDNTEIIIEPTAHTELGVLQKGVADTITLMRGESYQVRSQNGGEDLTGTTIKSTEESGSCRNFAVFSGTQCTNVPEGCTACDHMFDQNYPVHTWGRRYNVVPFFNTTSYTYRVLAKEDNTIFTVNGGTPINLNAGQYFESNLEFEPLCIVGLKEIAVVQYMQGISCSGNGDPAMLILNAEDQKIDQITFSTVQSTVITNHNLNIIVSTNDTGTILLDGNSISGNSFTVFPNCSDQAYAQLTISSGSHTLSSLNGLIAYSYGTGSAESYAYSVGSFDPESFLNVDTIFCTVDTIELINPLVLNNVFWTKKSAPNDTIGFGDTLKVVPDTIETYILSGLNNISGCLEQYKFLVDFPDTHQVALFSNVDSVCTFQEIQLLASVTPSSSLYSYEWTPKDDLNNGFVADPIARPSQSTWFFCTVESPTGCLSVTDSILITTTGNSNINNFNIEADPTIVCFGDSINITPIIATAFLQDKFNDSINTVLWDSIIGGDTSSLCGSISGRALLFYDSTQRYAMTRDLNLLQGGIIDFGLRIADGSMGCDDNEFGDDVVLEYSINSGGDWNTINIYYESFYPTFSMHTVMIPPGAATASTRFRWRQVNNSGLGTDHWAIDNVKINVNRNDQLGFSWSPNVYITDTTQASVKIFPIPGQYTYQLHLYDSLSLCEYNDSVDVFVADSFSFTLSGDTSVCEVLTEHMLSAQATIPGINYVWTPQVGLSCYDCDVPTVQQFGTQSYVVVASSGEGCAKQDTISIELRGSGRVAISPQEIELCLGDSIELVAGYYECGITPDSCEGGTVDTATLPIFIPFIGDGSSGNSEMTIFSGSELSAKRQFVYSVGELNLLAEGMTILDGLGFDLTDVDGGSDTFQNFTVKVGCSDFSSLSNEFIQGLSTVCLPRDFIVSNGYNSIELDSHYVWDGLSSLIVEICYKKIDTTSNATMNFGGSFFTFNTSLYIVGEDVCDSTKGTPNNRRPLVDLLFCRAPVINNSPYLSYQWTPDTLVAPDDSSIATASYNGIDSIFYLFITDTILDCTYSDSVAIVEKTSDYAPDVPQDTGLCIGSLISLSAGNVDSVLWVYNNMGDTAYLNPLILTIDTSLTFEVFTIDTVCRSRDTFGLSITALINPTVAIAGDSVGCANEQLFVFTDSTSSTISWAPIIYFSDPDSFETNLTLDSTRWISALVTDTNNCMAIDSQFVIIKQRPITNMPFDTVVCYQDSILFFAAGADSIIWTPQSISTGEDSFYVTVDSSYMVELILLDTICGNDTFETNITSIPYPVIELGQDTLICIGDIISLDLMLESHTIRWEPAALFSSPNISMTDFITDTDTQITVYVEDSFGCVSIDSLNINVESLPIVGLMDTVIIPLGQSYMIKGASGGNRYIWQPEKYLNCNDCQEPVSSAVEEILYELIISDSNEVCIVTDSILIIPLPITLDIPSVFTPNGDGLNDAFGPISFGIEKLDLFEVRDRWGKKLFETNQIGKWWDGTFKGIEQEIGSYRYSVKAIQIDGVVIERSGTFELVR